MGIELGQFNIDHSLQQSDFFNRAIATKPHEVLEAGIEVVQSATSPLTLSHQGLMVTPRFWSKDAKAKLGCISTQARLGLQRVAEFLAVSGDPLAAGIRKNMLGGRHFDQYQEILRIEAERGISTHPFEVGRADIISGGAIEVNAACLDAPVDIHDLTDFQTKLSEALDIQSLAFHPERSIVELILNTMIGSIQNKW